MTCWQAGLIAVLSLLLAGCPALRTAPETVAPSAAAMAPLPDRAVIYVFRDERFAADRHLSVAANSGRAMALPVGAFRRFVLEPGRQSVRLAGDGEARMALAVGPGERAFLRASVTVTHDGVGARLSAVGRDEGLEALRGARMLVRRGEGGTVSPPPGRPQG